MRKQNGGKGKKRYFSHYGIHSKSVNSLSGYQAKSVALRSPEHVTLAPVLLRTRTVQPQKHRKVQVFEGRQTIRTASSYPSVHRALRRAFRWACHGRPAQWKERYNRPHSVLGTAFHNSSGPRGLNTMIKRGSNNSAPNTAAPMASTVSRPK